MKRISKHTRKKINKRNLITSLTEYQREQEGDIHTYHKPKDANNRARKMGKTFGEFGETD